MGATLSTRRLRGLVTVVAVVGVTLAAPTAEVLAPRPAGAAVNPTPAIDPMSRASVWNAYDTSLVQALEVPSGWTGSTSSCARGAESAASKDATRAAVNFYRGLNRLPPVTFDATLNSQALAAAMMMEANGQLSHSPPSSWRCWTSDGAQAAGSSNLSLGRATGAASVAFGYMADPGSSNSSAGHRRWVLSPDAGTFGTGTTTRANALWVFGAQVDRPTDVTWVAWPNAGFVPVGALAPARGSDILFSLSSNQHPWADYSGASISVKVGGTTLAVDEQPQVDGYGDNTLTYYVTPPPGFRSGTADVVFTITVSGVRTDAGAPIPAHTYTSTAIAGAVQPEFAPFGSYADLVDELHLRMLGRWPTTTERSRWVTALAGSSTPGDLVAALRGGADHALSVDPVARLYWAYFRRIPDREGLDHWIAQRRGGRSLRSISEFFSRSREFVVRYGSLTNREFIAIVYENVLGRPGEADGVTFWVGELDSGRRGRGNVMAGFSESSEYKVQMARHVAVAVLHVQLLRRAPTATELAAGIAALSGGTTVAAYATALVARMAPS